MIFRQREVHPWAFGMFTRLADAHRPSEQGDIWVCKLGWWSGAPWDVLAYAKDHPTYPCDSTLEQLYDAAEFEAYHELGEATVLAAAQKCSPPLKCTVSAGADSPAGLHPSGQSGPRVPHPSGNGSGR